MKFREFIEAQNKLEAALKAAGNAFAVFDGERLPNGLTPDHIRALPAWQVAKKASEKAFADLRAFNGKHAKTFEGQTRKLLDLKRRARLVGGSTAIFNLNPYGNQFVMRDYVQGCELSEGFITAFHFEEVQS